MKKYTLFSFLILFSFTGISQDYYKEFIDKLEVEDTIGQKEILLKWEKSDSMNPELYVCYFNYFVNKAKKELVEMTKVRPNEESFVLKDSAGNIAGYMCSKIHYDVDIVTQGIKFINKGIELHPNRLDMRFGKIYVIGKTENWNYFTEEVIKTIQYSVTNKNKWTWSKNIKKKNAEEFFLTSIHSYQLQLYNTENDDLLLNMRKIGLEVIKFYPDNIQSLSNISITYMLEKNYKKAIEYLLKAEKLNPKDLVVLFNIAEGYKRNKNNIKAIEYYKKTLKYGNDRDVEFAKNQIEKLK